MDPTATNDVVLVTLVLIVVGVALMFWRDYANKKRKWNAEAAIPFCPQCMIELDLGANFCRQCRTRNLTNLAQFNKDQPFARGSAALESALAGPAAAIRAHKAKERLYEVRKAYDVLIECHYCPTCDKAFPADSPYCSECGKPTIAAPREQIFDCLHNKYPAVVKTEDDFRHIERMVSPLLGKTNRAVLSLGKFAFKFAAKKAGHFAIVVGKHAVKKGGHAIVNLAQDVTKSALRSDSQTSESANRDDEIAPAGTAGKTSSSSSPTEFKFNCHHCGQHILALLAQVGASGVCPGCGNELTIPTPASSDS